jgi:uncharacterized membrane protein (DUF4010 family)
VVAYVRSSASGEVGATTEIAAIVTFLLGALAGTGEILVAGATAVGVTVLLVAKVRLESFSRALGREEMVGALELAVISVIVLPLLPRQGYGPWGVFNPFEIWLVVVLVTALSFVGFVAMRLIGERRGLAVLGIVGGLVSSTAMTLSMAERSRAAPALGRQVAMAAVLASTVMCPRVAVLAGIANAALLPRVLPVLAAMALVGVGAAMVLGRGRERGAAKPGKRLANPFSLRRAMTFAAIYALVKFGVRAAQEYLGDSGMYAAAAVSALADVDAPTIAFARLAPTDGWRASATAIAIAAISNTFVKLGMAVGLGAGAFRRYVAVALAAMGIVGAIVAAIVHSR